MMGLFMMHTQRILMLRVACISLSVCLFILFSLCEAVPASVTAHAMNLRQASEPNDPSAPSSETLARAPSNGSLTSDIQSFQSRVSSTWKEIKIGEIDEDVVTESKM